MINKTWIIYDTRSTYSVTNHLDCVEDMNNWAKDEEMTVLTNVRLPLFDRRGDFTFLHFIVHVNKKYPATIRSLKYVNNILGLCVNMNKLTEEDMHIIRSDGTVYKFKECGMGL